MSIEHNNDSSATLGTWKATYLLFRLYPWLCLTDALLWVLVGFFPVIVGQITRMIFDLLTDADEVRFGFWTLIVLLLAAGLTREIVAYNARHLNFFHITFFLEALMIKNLNQQVFDRPGAQATISTPGEMVSRFSGDILRVRELATWLLVAMTHFTTLIISLPIMFSLAPTVTMVVFVPMLLAVILVNVMQRRMQAYRAAARKAEGQVTSFVGEMFGAIQAIKVANCIDDVCSHFRQLNEKRHIVSLKDSLFNAVWTSMTGNIRDLSIGIILLLIGRSMSTGTFTVGDFTFYMTLLLPVSLSLHVFNNIFAMHKQATVSIKRIGEITEFNRPELALVPGPTYVRGKTYPAIPYISKTSEHQLNSLRIQNLTYRYPETGRGIENVDLNISPGSFIAITGRIGSGKTTLLRALLGLLPAQGDIYWNHQRVTDPGNFFTPPRSAYVPQIPRLLNSTVLENILLGLPEDKTDISAAIHRAVLEKDLQDFEHGLHTEIGVRGVKLSGGQMQRMAAARMFIREPELYVFDDISSALDVNTERLLWQRFFAADIGTNGHPASTTCLVVTHSHWALRQADHILVLKDGKVIDEGKLDDLLNRCEEMQKLWQDGLKKQGEHYE